MVEDKPYRFRSDTDNKKPNSIFIIGILVVMLVLIVGFLTFVILQKNANNQGKIQVQSNKTDTNVTEAPTCDNNCIYARALKDKNVQDCKLLSGDQLEQNCYQALSSNSLEACSLILDLEKKKSCIIVFAVSGKNLSLCDMLNSNTDNYNSCRVSVDPCLQSSDKPLCYALQKNDTSFCKTDTCLINYSISKHSAEACKLITNNVVEKACEASALLLDKCSQLSLQVERDYCYELNAIYTNDYLTCSMITPGYSYALDCYSYFAAAKKDLNICNVFTLNNRWQCYSTYSLLTDSLDGCKKIDSLATTSIFNCVFNYAKKYGDAAACDAIDDVGQTKTCYQGVIIYSPVNLNWTRCTNVTNNDWKNKCYNEAAKKYDNSSICNYTSPDSAKQTCLLSYNSYKSASGK